MSDDLDLTATNIHGQAMKSDVKRYTAKELCNMGRPNARIYLEKDYAALQQQLVDERKQNELLQQALEASDPDKLKQQLAQAQEEVAAYKKQSACQYCGGHHFNATICSKCCFLKPTTELYETLGRVYHHEPRPDGQWDHAVWCNTIGKYPPGTKGVTCNCRIASRKERDELQARLTRLDAALQSIAKNTCCGPCQEAALVARKALQNQPPRGRVVVDIKQTAGNITYDKSKRQAIIMVELPVEYENKEVRVIVREEP